MNAITQSVALLCAPVLVGVGILEIFHHGNQRFRPIFYVEPGTERAVRMWAMNIGMVNILTAASLCTGVWLSTRADPLARGAGIGIVLADFAAYAILGVWLWVTEHRLWRSAIGQTLPPVVGLVAFAIAG